MSPRAKKNMVTYMGLPPSDHGNFLLCPGGSKTFLRQLQPWPQPSLLGIPQHLTGQFGMPISWVAKPLVFFVAWIQGFCCLDSSSI